MLRPILRCLVLLCAGLVPAAAAPAPPRLVVVISVDQFRADYLLRFRAGYSEGLDRLLKQGAVFTNAYLEHFPTVTAIGHAAMLTGAPPALSGIVGNSWYDRETGRAVSSVSDPSVPLLGAPGPIGSSPHNLLASTAGDQLKMMSPGSKVIGISMKDRAAILTAGRMADAAYWYDARTGNFVSSSHYFDKLPRWAEKFNLGPAAERYAGRSWAPVSGSGEPFTELPGEAAAPYYDELRYTPFGNDLLEAFAETAVRAENLGRRDATDILIVSFSSNDHAGHRWGPDSPQVRDLSVRTDRVLGTFLELLDSSVGLEDVLIVFTADHGVAPVPEVQRKRGMPSGRLIEKEIFARLDARLDREYGAGDWIIGASGPSPYFDHALIAERDLDLAEVRRVAAGELRNIPRVLRVYTYDGLAAGRTPVDHIDRRVINGFHPERGADLYFVLEPYWMFGRDGTTHGSPHHYDSHVPLILMGAGIRTGRYRNNIAAFDIAPTLTAILGVDVPSGSTGRVLTEALALE